MSSTQASQTLFSFVSVRSPQLSDKEGKDKRFIFRPDEVKNQAASVNVFDAAAGQATSANRWDLLNNAAATFKATGAYLSTESATEDLAGKKLYTFAIWLARNRDSFANAEFQEKALAAGAPLSTATLTRLWNNLFYQVITQESFYIKETIIQLLTANHVVSHMDSSDTARGIRFDAANALATLVLPKDLFLDKAGSGAAAANIAGRIAAEEAATDEPQHVQPGAALKKKLAVIDAKQSNEQYESVKKAVLQIEKDYKKEYSEAYELAFQKHQEAIRPMVDDYIQKREDAKKEWCSIRGNDTPMSTDDPCNQPPYIPQPELPKFDFSFTPELEYLERRLPADDFALITGADAVDESSASNDKAEAVAHRADAFEAQRTIASGGFATVYSTIDGATTANNDVIVTGTVNNPTGVISLGGISLPLPTTSGLTGGCQNFAASTSSFHLPGQWFLRIVFENSNVSIASAAYEVYDMSGNLRQSDTVVDNIDGSYYTIFNGLNGHSLLQISDEIRTGFVLKGTFTLTDGNTYKFALPLAQDIAGGIDRITKLYNLKGAGSICKIVQTGGGTTGTGGTQTTSSFKPSGFGAKQLGIADYKKVEQSVHCYVEGEVAHIENIMAREYKEKSTRRLRRSENTSTTSSESEREKLTDTTSTDRFEMQNEVAKVLQDSRDFSANAHVSFKIPGPMQTQIDAGAAYASHNSKEQSTRAAVTQAKDITQRAMDRVVSRVKQERIEKVIEEFEENNKHGFDNTKGDKHVVGVYRWVDKIYKNQIYNYGKRLMFEFMIPEPAKLHLLGMKDTGTNGNTKVLVKPTDPRTASSMAISTSAAVGENEARYWASMFNADIEAMPAEYAYTGKSYADSKTGDNECYSKSEDIEIPEGYVATYAKTFIYGVWDQDNKQRHSMGVTIGNAFRFVNEQRSDFTYENYLPLSGIGGRLSIGYQVLNYLSFNISVVATLQRTPALLAQWRQQTFKAIIDAYEKALAKYEDDLAQQVASAGNVIGTNPGFYRDIENAVLRKNCISYIIDQNPAAKLTYGKKMYKTAGQDSFTGYEVDVTKDLDDYAAFAKFLEQAFEWEIMSYYFYPFYWGNRADWTSLYQYDNNDPLFRSFMQSGLARAIVTVRPGFEDAVRFYMQTGLIWNGGEVPVIDDPLYLAVVDEMKEPQGLPEGKAWATRVPTSLTILQADSIGLKVEKALPCNCDDVTADTWENPDAVPCGDNFHISEDTMNNASAKPVVQFSFTNMDGGFYTNIQSMDEDRAFPRIYECMGQQIAIQRDANWAGTESTVVVFEKLADQLSLIPGVKAVQKTARGGNHGGITFTIDSSIAPQFTFTKPGGGSAHDTVNLTITNESVSFTSPESYLERILDKSDTALGNAEANTLLPISRFKV